MKTKIFPIINKHMFTNFQNVHRRKITKKYSTDKYKKLELFKTNIRERLREYVQNILLGWNVNQHNIVFLYVMPDKSVFNINVLSSQMKCRIIRKVYSTLVINI